MEGIALEHFKPELVNALINEENDEAIHAVFHSFLSDDSKQDGATCAAHSKHIIKELIDSNVLKTGLSTL